MKILLTIFLFLYSSVCYANISTGMLGWWKFDDGSGVSAIDSSGNGNTGALQNSPVWISGKVGGALSFNGTNQDVSIASSFGLTNINLSITGWTYRSALGNHGAFFKIGNNTDASGGDGFAIGIGGSGSSGFETSGNNLLALYEGARWIDTGLVVTTGWHQFALVINASGFPNVYWDGVSVYSDSIGVASVIGSKGASITQIGGYTASNAANRFFTGYLDDVRVYGRPLSAGDVTQLYNVQNTILLNKARLNNFKA